MENNNEQLVRIVPPKEMFESEALPSIPTHAIAESELVTPVYHIDTPEEGGILSYQVGAKFPVKGLVFREAICAVDTIKRAIINGLKFITSSPVRYVAALFMLLPASWKKRIIDRAIIEFNDYTTIVFDRWGRIMQFEEDGQVFGLQGVKWKPQFYCDMVREVRRVALEIVGDNEAYQTLISTICMILEFDDGYRYRIQDLFGELKRGAFLANPGAETKRLFQIAAGRGEGTKKKFAQFAKLVPFVFLFGSVRRLARQFIITTDLQKLSLDEADIYRCLLWGGWSFKGMPDDVRISTRMLIDAQWGLETKGRSSMNANT